MNEGVLGISNRNIMKNFHNKCYCLFTQFTFKMNSTNTAKEGIHELCNRNMMKTFITNVIVFTQFTYK